MNGARSVARLVLQGLALACALFGVALAQSPTLTVSDRGAKTVYSREQLLADPAVRDLTIADPVRHRTMTYRAIPAAELLKGLKIGADDYVQARATDNFSIGMPARLLTAKAAAPVEAFLAIEDPAQPWPTFAKGAGQTSGGPFYLVWRIGPAGHVSQEYWAYNLAALDVTDGPLKRWPGLAVAADIPATDPIRTGLDHFLELCISCHKFNGEGEGDQGPDLGRPMNPVDYYQRPALKKLIRDPASVRKWPDQKMPAFSPASLSDYDLDAIVAWLTYKAHNR